MRRITILTFLIFIAQMLPAQNAQLHYDFSEGRNYTTATLEMFRPDEYGATFWFVDFDFDQPHANTHPSMSLSYFEFARYVTIPGVDPLSATVQYNDGTVSGFPLGPIWLFGASYPINIGGVTISTDLLYRHAFNSDGPDGQLTLVWTEQLFNEKVTFTGFLDLWTTDAADNGKELVLLSEPQIWYHAGQHLQLGGELEISNNFLPGEESVQARPTLGIKWAF